MASVLAIVASGMNSRLSALGSELGGRIDKTNDRIDALRGEFDAFQGEMPGELDPSPQSPTSLPYHWKNRATA